MAKYIDGVKVYENTEEGENYALFDDWASANGYVTREELKMKLLIDGCSDEEIDDQIAELEDEFLNWCDDYDVIGEV